MAVQAARRGRRGVAFRLAAVVVAAAVGLGIVETTKALSSPSEPSRPRPPAELAGMRLHMHGDQPHYHEVADTAGTKKLTKAERLARKARGLVFDGLRRVDREHPCRSGYVINTGKDSDRCSHGPDAAPEGVDVRVRPSAEELATTTSAAASDTGADALPCYGDGVTGPRVQAIYTHAADVPDRFGEIGALIPRWAARVDAVFSRSAAETGGTRHVQWVTNAGCSLSVVSVELSATGDDSLDNTISELTAKGFNRTDRKYLIWADAARYCGVGEILNDDSPAASNRNNFGPSFARVDASCWGQVNSVEAHELMHTLGGVQLSAPRSTGAWHCTDENDRMCLAEGSAPLAFNCPSTHETLFDCGNDDYYNTAPAAGSYLASHWNTANSSFLSASTPEACSFTSVVSETATKEKTKKRAGRKRHRRHRGQAADTATVAATACLPTTAFSS